MTMRRCVWNMANAATSPLLWADQNSCGSPVAINKSAPHRCHRFHRRSAREHNVTLDLRRPRAPLGSEEFFRDRSIPNAAEMQGVKDGRIGPSWDRKTALA